MRTSKMDIKSRDRLFAGSDLEGQDHYFTKLGTHFKVILMCATSSSTCDYINTL